MSRTPLPPEGSSIHVADETSALSLSWIPPRSSGVARGFVAAFMAFWLCGWAFGEVTVVRTLWRDSASTPSLFLLAWLGAWTLVGVFAVATIWRLLRPSSESTLRLSADALAYHEGHSPPALYGRGGLFGNRDQWEVPRALWRRRVKVEIPRAGVRNPKLERVGGELRLTIDHGADRVAIGRRLREPDLEWLHGVLREWIPDPGSALPR